MKRKPLSDEAVRQILRRCVNGRSAGKRGGHPDSQTSLAKEFNVPQSSVSRILSRDLYRHVRV